MIARRLLDQLDGVRQTGRDRWIARCPAHDDRSPSLSIREVEDCVLAYCHAGCSIYDIVSAIGIELSDLFPPRPADPEHRTRPLRHPIPSADVLRCLMREATYLMICAGDLARGETLAQLDLDRLVLARARIQAGLVAGGLV